MITPEQFNSWLEGTENEHLEFKEAKEQYDLEKLIRYCVAIANERGGEIILGVTDKPPRRVVGSRALSNLEQTKAKLIDQLRLRINIEILQHPNGRVVIIDVPSRPIGIPLHYKGEYLMRAGGNLAPMPPDMLKRIFAEGQPDFSAEICPGAVLSDLDSTAITDFRVRWQRKTGNKSILQRSDEQLLKDAELISDQGITYAALILFGSSEALGRCLPQAEVIFEYRSSDTSIPFQQRKEFRRGFFLFFDELWETINLRNNLQHFQDGLFIWDIPTFNEEAVREALNNAISHRDYRLGGSIFVRQFPTKLEIISPGGLPEGITPENIHYRQYPRNRRIAESFGRCGLVERSGQGFDKMIVQCIRESKPRPDFSRTDAHQVYLTLHGNVQDPHFLRFLEKIGAETQKSFSVEDFMVLDLLSREEPIPDVLSGRLQGLKATGVIESVGRGRGTRYILSKRFYDFTGKRGLYTRRRGLDKEQNKTILLQHLEHYGKGTIKDFEDALSSLKSRSKIQKMLAELAKEGKVRHVGPKKSGYWEKVS